MLLDTKNIVIIVYTAMFHAFMFCKTNIIIACP